MSDKIKTIREALEDARIVVGNTHLIDDALSALDQLAPTAEIVKAGDAMHKMLDELHHNVKRSDEDYAADIDEVMRSWKLETCDIAAKEQCFTPTNTTEREADFRGHVRSCPQSVWSLEPGMMSTDACICGAPTSEGSATLAPTNTDGELD